MFLHWSILLLNICSRRELKNHIWTFPLGTFKLQITSQNQSHGSASPSSRLEYLVSIYCKFHRYQIQRNLTELNSVSPFKMYGKSRIKMAQKIIIVKKEKRKERREKKKRKRKESDYSQYLKYDKVFGLATACYLLFYFHFLSPLPSSFSFYIFLFINLSLQFLVAPIISGYCPDFLPFFFKTLCPLFHISLCPS